MSKSITELIGLPEQTVEDLKKMKQALRDVIELAGKASEGPWRKVHPEGYVRYGGLSLDGPCVQSEPYQVVQTGNAAFDVIAPVCMAGEHESNVSFIIAARTLAPTMAQTLLDAIDALERVSLLALRFPGMWRGPEGDEMDTQEFRKLCQSELQRMVDKHKEAGQFLLNAK